MALTAFIPIGYDPESASLPLNIMMDSSRNNNPDGSQKASGIFDDEDTMVVVRYNSGWNLIATPVKLQNGEVNHIFPGVQAVFTYDALLGKYGKLNQIKPIFGYWAKFSGGYLIQYAGKRNYRDSISVISGWNLVGSLSKPVQKSTLLIKPGGSVIAIEGPNSNGVWQSNAQTLYPGYGYWVKVSASGMLIVSTY